MTAKDSWWTEQLVDPLPRVLADKTWNRVEQDRRGRWLCLADEGDGEGSAWYRLCTGEGLDRLEPISLVVDERLPQGAHLLGEWLHQGYTVQVLGHKLGKRAIIKLHSQAGDRIAKIYRKPRGVRKRWKALPSDPEQRWSVPRVISWDEEFNCLTVEMRPGTSLNHRWLAGAGRRSDSAPIVELLDWLATVPFAGVLQQHTIEEEVRGLRDRLPVFLHTLRQPPPRVGTLVDEVVEALEGADETRSVPCHRDFHDKQILCEPDANGELTGGGTLIDLDMLALGPPALDAATIISHLHLRHLKGVALPWREMAADIAEACRERAGSHQLHRWVAATLMRLTLIYCRRRRNENLLDAMIESTDQAVHKRGCWRGIL